MLKDLSAVRFLSESVDAAGFGLEGRRVPHARFAVHAADAFARTSGASAVAVCCGKYEALQALAALASAFGDGIAVHLVCALQPTDVPAVRRAAGALAGRVYDRDGLHPGVPGSPVRVSLAVHPEELRAFVEEPFRVEAAPYSQCPALRLSSRERVLIVCGRSALLRTDPRELRGVAESLSAPVLLGAAAAAASPQCLERYRTAFHGSDLLIPAGGIFWTLALYEADVLFVLGDKLTESEGYGLHDFPLVRGRVIELELDQLRAVAGSSPRRRRFAKRLARRQERMIAGIRKEAERAQTKRPLDPLYVAQAAFDRAPEDTIFVAEGNGTGMFQWSVNQQLRPVIYPVRMATIGLLLPYAAGVHAANRGPVWCFAGDGSLRYEPELLGELARRKVRCVILVFRNAAWDSIRLEQTFVLRGRYPGTELREQDYAGFAEQHGCAAMRVGDHAQLEAALSRAALHDEGRPLLIDIHVRKDQIPVAGLTWALAELDYILAAVPKWHVLLSFMRAILRRRLPLRILRLLWRSV